MAIKGTLCQTVATLAAVMIVAACGDNAQEQARVDTCTKVALAALKTPQDFKVVATDTQETSEGIGMILSIEYKDTSGATKTVEDRCWFAGSNADKLTEFAIKAADGFHNVPADKFNELRKSIGG